MIPGSHSSNSGKLLFLRFPFVHLKEQKTAKNFEPSAIYQDGKSQVGMVRGSKDHKIYSVLTKTNILEGIYN